MHGNCHDSASRLIIRIFDKVHREPTNRGTEFTIAEFRLPGGDEARTE